MAIFDCFIFNNEFDLLDIRLREMSDVVDRFVLVETNETHTGCAKPFHFEMHRERFSPWAAKIVHVKVTFPKELPPARGKRAREGGWEREHFQREQILSGLAEAAPDDLVLVSDVDEIVRADKLREAVGRDIARGRLVIFEVSSHRFFLDRYYPQENTLLCSRMMERRHLASPQLMRMTQARVSKRRKYPTVIGSALVRAKNFIATGIPLPVAIVPDAGWHFSSMGGIEAFREKLASISEGNIVARNGVELVWQRYWENLAPYPRERLPACVAGGGFDHLLAKDPD
ncbi:hypothetical protein [Afifella sp. IM 167]|uniref:hypothetical protein n=1 Tax=Afifella sp. IM 167 TaxID=2033586 RepID=UPI001CCD24CA|nr:hypothetical protein [Afifella sp. IM 167]